MAGKGGRMHVSNEAQAQQRTERAWDCGWHITTETSSGRAASMARGDAGTRQGDRSKHETDQIWRLVLSCCPRPARG